MTEPTSAKPARLHYLDWLQVLAVLGVFLFHSVHPFDDLADWHIKNVEKSILATFFVGFFNLWGMPFLFLMAGATSWFSLRRSTIWLVGEVDIIDPFSLWVVQNLCCLISWLISGPSTKINSAFGTSITPKHEDGLVPAM